MLRTVFLLRLHIISNTKRLSLCWVAVVRADGSGGPDQIYNMFTSVLPGGYIYQPEEKQDDSPSGLPSHLTPDPN